MPIGIRWIKVGRTSERGGLLGDKPRKAPHRRVGEMSVDAVRTPDEATQGLPDYPFESRYREVDGLRLAHLDEGEGKPVVFFHGEPTWSFLWRKVIPPVRDAGYRCIAPDYAGFGRSDKPTDLGWYTYDRHVELMALADRGARPARRHRRRPRLGRPDRAAARGRAPRPLLPHRDHGDRPLHRPPEDERRLVRLPRLRPRQRGRADRVPGQRRLQERPRRGGRSPPTKRPTRTPPRRPAPAPSR